MKKLLLLIIAFGLTTQNSFAQHAHVENFQSPPNEAKPRVWWHWMNGNITQEGVQKDLDWMERTGIGGFQNFDANLLTPVVVSEKLVYMTPKWKEVFKFTTELAEKKGLEMAIAGSPGWSVTGGPWVEPRDGMKKYVWTETRVSGGKSFSGKLAQPSDKTGKFQMDEVSAGGMMSGFVGDIPHYYQDALVIAYPLANDEKSLVELNPKMTSSGGEFALESLTDTDITNSNYLPPMEVGEDMWVQYEFPTPQTFKAFGVAGASQDPMAEFNGAPENRSLKVSDDGLNFRVIAKVSGSTVPFNTVSIPATTAKYWRLCYETIPPVINPMIAMFTGNRGEPKPEGVQVAEFALYPSARIDQVEDKAGFSPWEEDHATFLAKDVQAISKNEVLDLTSKMQTDGTLNWDVPAGNWMIVRLGYSLTGRQNHPASPEATGLEVDKLDEDAVRKYINTYLDLYKDATGGLMGEKGLSHMILDSYEAGHMNWTHDFPQEFQQRRGYDIRAWIPVLTGRIVESTEASEKFLWDFRKTIGEMIAENHYDVIGEELHKRGMKRYTESHENKRIYLADGMDVKRHADIPMSAMWTPGSLAGGNDEEPRSEADIRESASVANIYGKPIVAAESMTSVGKTFQEYPEKLKRTADLELASGLNRFVIHTSVHQPLDDKKPGFSLGPFGQYFTRHETWSGAGAKAWMSYLGRSSYLMQQGRNVADILYYYGENTNITWICREQLPEIPQGYEFDFVNATALKEAIQAKDAKLLAQSGNEYSFLMLDESASYMTLPVLRKIGELAKAGVKVKGKKPVGSPSLSDDAEAFNKLANEIWSMKQVGPDVSISTKPDVLISNTNHEIRFRHRKTADKDIYWLNNRSVEPTEALISFRVNGKVPMLWNAETGDVHAVSYEIKEGRTLVPLALKSWDAVFIIFDEPAKISSLSLPKPVPISAQELSEGWKVDFAGLTKEMKELSSWTHSDDTKYFSGTAVYTQTFTQNSTPKKGEQYLLDLGEMKNVAEVSLNGQTVGTIWKKPYQIEVTSALKKGENKLEIKVTNLWVNRLVGDAQADVPAKSTFTTMPFYRADSPLLPSGLLGKVNLLRLK